MHSIFNCIFMEMSFFSAHRQASKAKKKLQDLKNFFHHYSQIEAKNKEEEEEV